MTEGGPEPDHGTLGGMGGSNGLLLASEHSGSERQLRKCVRLHRGVYAERGVQVDAEVRARAAWLYSGGAAVLAGRSAAAVHGTRYLDPHAHAELIRPRSASKRTSGALVVHNEDLMPAEIGCVQGMRVTSPARTAFDLGRRIPGDAAVVLLDALFQATSVSTADVLRVAESHPRAVGSPRLRAVLPLVDGGAESPQETRTRLLIVRHGLPAPQTQVNVHDEDGIFCARLDMAWPQWKVAVEYDGAWHWEQRGQRGRDVMRHERLTALGWRVVRVTAEQLRTVPAAVVGRILEHLRLAGGPFMY